MVQQRKVLALRQRARRADHPLHQIEGSQAVCEDAHTGVARQLQGRVRRGVLQGSKNGCELSTRDGVDLT